MSNESADRLAGKFPESQSSFPEVYSWSDTERKTIEEAIRHQLEQLKLGTNIEFDFVCAEQGTITGPWRILTRSYPANQQSRANIVLYEVLPDASERFTTDTVIEGLRAKFETVWRPPADALDALQMVNDGKLPEGMYLSERPLETDAYHQVITRNEQLTPFAGLSMSWLRKTRAKLRKLLKLAPNGRYTMIAPSDATPWILPIQTIQVVELIDVMEHILEEANLGDNVTITRKKPGKSYFQEHDILINESGVSGQLDDQYVHEAIGKIRDLADDYSEVIARVWETVDGLPIVEVYRSKKQRLDGGSESNVSY